jgi:hypothetical protein
MEAETTYHGGTTFHGNEDGKSKEEPHVKHDHNTNDTDHTGPGQSRSKGHAPQHGTQLLVGK